MPSTRLEDGHPKLIERYLKGRSEYESANPGHKLIVTCTHRTPEEQQALYAKGRTKPGQIVTYIDGKKKLSNHNYLPSRALDFAVTVEGKITWNAEEYRRVGPYMRDCGLKWGGDWSKFKDYPHLEMPNEEL